MAPVEFFLRAITIAAHQSLALGFLDRIRQLGQYARWLPVGVLIRRAVRALGVTLGFLFADEPGVDFPGRVIIHRRRGLRPGREGRAAPSVCEVDDEMAAGRFNRGLIDLDRKSTRLNSS